MTKMSIHSSNICVTDRKKNKGWLRRCEATLRGIALAKKDGKPRIQLVEEENVVLVEIVREVDRLWEIMNSQSPRALS